MKLILTIIGIALFAYFFICFVSGMSLHEATGGISTLIIDNIRKIIPW